MGSNHPGRRGIPFAVHIMVGHQEAFLHWKGHWALEGAAQGAGRAPGAVPETPQCSGLVVRMVFGQRLDSMISEVFSQPKQFRDSLIPAIVSSITSFPLV